MGFYDALVFLLPVAVKPISAEIFSLKSWQMDDVYACLKNYDLKNNLT